MFKIITEGKAKVKVPTEEKISKDLPVFYNPIMKLNRDLSVDLLNAVEKKEIQIASPLAGTGVREIRFLLELKKGTIQRIEINDIDEEAEKIINENIKLNLKEIKKNQSKAEIIVARKEANKFLLDGMGYDYIDIDPFGSPIRFLDSACARLARQGILAVTATDTSALCGTFPKACQRKYWAKPLRNELMHELGIRILIRRVQMIGTEYDKALTPILSYSTEHYMRVFFLCEKGKEKVDEMLKMHNCFEGAGPLWTGQLWDEKLVAKIAKQNKNKENQKLLDTLKEESKIKTIGFHDIHAICKRNKKQIPKTDDLIQKIKEKGYKVAKTHFRENSLRSDIKVDEFVELIK
jgi:tRNA (guanine26-N2/guanine27-N2)-dimethyltransferase